MPNSVLHEYNVNGVRPKMVSLKLKEKHYFESDECSGRDCAADYFDMQTGQSDSGRHCLRAANSEAEDSQKS